MPTAQVELSHDSVARVAGIGADAGARKSGGGLPPGWRVCQLVAASPRLHPSDAVYDDGKDRIGSALRRMAEDLVTERRQVRELMRENRALRAELERLKQVEQPRDQAAVGESPSG